MLQVLITISLKCCCRKETRGYAKVIQKKEKKKKRKKKELRKKWTSVQDIENNGYSDAHLKRKKRDE
jgi:hypothetical protein